MERKLVVKKIDESTMMLYSTNPDVLDIMRSNFTFFAFGYQHMPAYRSGAWDGKVSLMFGDHWESDVAYLPVGLSYELAAICRFNMIKLEIANVDYFRVTPYNIEAMDFVNKMTLEHTPYSHQMEAIEVISKNNRGILESATNSGKTFIIYALAKIWLEMLNLSKIAVIVPNTKLLNQTFKDFDTYNKYMDPNFTSKYATKLSSKTRKDYNPNMPIVFAAWQSFCKLTPDELSYYDGIITDEGHLASAKSQQYIIKNCINAKHRVTMTGSLRKSKVDVLILKGGYGRVYHIIDAKETIDLGISTPINIVILELNYPSHVVKQINAAGKDPSTIEMVFCPIEMKMVERYNNALGGKLIYQAAKEMIMNCTQRHLFIAKHAVSQTYNSLILTVQRKHGEDIKEIIEAHIEAHNIDKKVFYVDGDSKLEYFEEVMEYISKHDDAILVSTYSSLSTGVDNPNIHNAYLADSIKAFTTLKQVIGRIMRLNSNKKVATIYDVADNIPKYKVHLESRKETYEESRHNYHTEKYDIL